MPAVVEYFFRPGNFVTRLIAKVFNIPTCGLIRSGEECYEYGHPWENVVAFKASNHKEAEILGLSVKRIYASGMSEISAALANEGMVGFFTRRDVTGIIKRIRIKNMTHPKAPITDDISEIFNADGTPATQHLAKVLHSLGQILAGHTAVTNGKASQTDLGNGKFHVSIEFDRQD